MKLIYTIWIVLVSITAFAQNYQTVEEVNSVCDQLGFSSDEEAHIAVDNIMEIIGLQKNFIIQKCPNINNAVAKNITDKSGNIKRYILYDSEFFSNMDIKAGSDWAAISILAHEIGHHLNGHALNNKGSNHKFELDADYFSGLILAKMGATLEEAQSAIQTFRYEKATATHPAKQDRLNEIEKGWTKGDDYKNRGNTTNDTPITDAMEPLVQELYRKAKKGDASAQSSLGYFYYSGNGVEKDYDKAVKWTRKAAEQGNATGQNNLGNMYSNGNGVERDYNKAQKWTHRAAEQGNASGQFNLGVAYAKGEGVEQDYFQAAKWTRRAAEQGHALGQAILGSMYVNGNGVEKDYDEAVKWFRKAAEQGDAQGQNYLGVMYYEGAGVEKDYNEALKWFRKSARKDYKDSQEKLTKLGESW
ncbi:sel1 repeat family protein [Marixanthomonas ophiurae]|uniref:Sel1 repeat family protein n=1 Tax=Marixanthomonas ophiurae TaxID=387659 RepID=A0A3E1Q7W2_9FLAO|nr:sel1 repeat family protein [Marixanthomonas ophiurae]RFN58208.1 hypothetical protein DZ858_13325 [Marixanthomonas ophiurae]